MAQEAISYPSHRRGRGGQDSRVPQERAGAALRRHN